MAICYNCGDSITFFHNGFQVIPIHDSGSCSGRSGGYSGGGSSGGWSAIRRTSEGEVFEFPFVTYPSYVNPNARCPVCLASVYFYQSPHGGRVFFDELGPPWPKHPCTDNPDVRQHFATAESRSRFLVGSSYAGTTGGSEDGYTEAVQFYIPAYAGTTPGSEDGLAAVEQETPDGAPRHESRPRHLPAWSEAGWMPFIVATIIPGPYGIEAKGKLFDSPGGSPLEFRVKQTSRDAIFRKKKDGVSIGFSLVQNANQIISALNECPILLKKDPDLGTLLLSSFALLADGTVEEITLSVNGESIR